jgi:hypothetical protein
MKRERVANDLWTKKQSVIRLFEETKRKHKKLGNLIHEMYVYVAAVSDKDLNTLNTWRWLDALAEELVQHNVIIDKPYYVLESGWFRALTAKIITTRENDYLSQSRLSTMYFDLGWDLNDAINQDRDLDEKTHKSFLVNYPTGDVVYKIRSVPNHPTPIDSYWRNKKSGNVWRVSYHPKNNYSLVFIENQDGYGAIANRVSCMLSDRWERVNK